MACEKRRKEAQLKHISNSTSEETADVIRQIELIFF